MNFRPNVAAFFAFLLCLIKFFCSKSRFYLKWEQALFVQNRGSYSAFARGSCSYTWCSTANIRPDLKFLIVPSHAFSSFLVTMAVVWVVFCTSPRLEYLFLPLVSYKRSLAKIFTLKWKSGHQFDNLNLNSHDINRQWKIRDKSTSCRIYWFVNTRGPSQA